MSTTRVVDRGQRSDAAGTGTGTPHLWHVRDAVACWALLVATGFPFALWHPWVEVRSPSAVVFVLVCGAVTAAVWVSCFSRFAQRLPRALVIGAAIALWLRFLAYDLELRVTRAQGADNTEALEVGAQALLHLQDPYGLSTHTGNPIAPLLGGLLLALPLYWLMGSLFLQLLLSWAGAAALAEWRAPRASLAVIVLVWAAPWARGTLPYLNDNGLTALFVIVAAAWGYHLAARSAGWLPRTAWTVLMACALDYRWTMWIIAVPLGVLFLRRFGLRTALAWLAPVLAATLALFVAPMFFPSGGYLDRTLQVLLDHGTSTTGTSGSALVVAVTLGTVCVASVFVRSLRDVWAVMSVSLLVVLTAMSLLWLPEHTVYEAFYRYDFFWYLGWPLVFGIAYLVTPRELPARWLPSARRRHEPVATT